MPVHATNARRAARGAERALRLREELWPEVPEELLWSRHRHDGFSTFPRTMPHLMNIIDALSKNQPAGRAYFSLWCRAYDQALIVIENPASVAAESGFSGERAITTWRQRMTTLKELGFIKAHKGPAGEFHYVLILNPHRVVWKLKADIPRQLFLPLLDRATEIGATDMSENVEGEDGMFLTTTTTFQEGLTAQAIEDVPLLDVKFPMATAKPARKPKKSRRQ